MRKAIFILAMFIPMVSLAEHHDWEDNHVLQINREPARAYFIPFAESQGDRMLSLNGAWSFRWTKTQEGVDYLHGTQPYRTIQADIYPALCMAERADLPTL